MPITNFTYGVSSWGMPVIGSGGINTTGNVWFVNSGGTNAQDGTSPQTAFRTVASAISVATAANGDVIFLMPGHAETITSASSFGSISKSGVRIVALGLGSLRATFTFTTIVSATINITAANVSFTNCLFVANFADVVSCFTTTTAKNFQLFNCEMRDTTSVLNFNNIVDTNTTSNDTDGLTLVGCNWYGLTATAASAVIKMDGTNTRLTVTDCYFAQASVDDSAKFMPIATGKVVTNMQLLRNIFNLADVSSATAGILITTNGSTNTGMIGGNWIQALDATSEILVTASSGFIFSQNYYSGAPDKSGYLLPAADS